jgi:hypothetical protein
MTETDEESRAREELARQRGEKVLKHIFANLSFNLGPVEAKRFFDDASKLLPHRPRGSENAQRNAKLLATYNLAAQSAANFATLPRAIAKSLHQTAPTVFGNSPSAIEKQIRRLLKQRRWEAAQAEELRRSIFGIGQEVAPARGSRRRVSKLPTRKSSTKKTRQ